MVYFLDFELLQCRGLFTFGSRQNLLCLEDFDIYCQWFDSFLIINDDSVQKADESLLLNLFIYLGGEYFNSFINDLDVSFSSYQGLIFYFKCLRMKENLDEAILVTEEVFYLIEDSVETTVEVEYKSARVLEGDRFNSFKVTKPEILFDKLVIFNREFGELLENEENEKIEYLFENELFLVEVKYKASFNFFKVGENINIFQSSEISKCVECEYEKIFSLVLIKFQNFLVVSRSLFYFRGGEDVGKILNLFSGKFVFLKVNIESFFKIHVFFRHRNYYFINCSETRSSQIPNYKYRRKVLEQMGQLS